MKQVKFNYGTTIPTAAQLGAGGLYFNTSNRKIYFAESSNTLHTFSGEDLTNCSLAMINGSFGVSLHTTAAGAGILFQIENTDSTTNYIGVVEKGHFVPGANNSQDLGSATKMWKTVYAKTFQGNASSATQLTTSAGSTTNPVYFSSGKPTACSYSLNKTVPANAVFTDTKNTAGSTNNTNENKLFIVGAKEQDTNPQTYSNSKCYMWNGRLYSNDTCVSTVGHWHSVSITGDIENLNVPEAGAYVLEVTLFQYKTHQLFFYYHEKEIQLPIIVEGDWEYQFYVNTDGSIYWRAKPIGGTSTSWEAEYADLKQIHIYKLTAD